MKFSYIRNTPYPVSSTGAFKHADSARPNTRRVCAGSRMPSSQRRAVGAAFALVFVEGGLLEGARLVGAQGRVTPAGELTLLDGEQHVGGLLAASNADKLHPQKVV